LCVLLLARLLLFHLSGTRGGGVNPSPEGCRSIERLVTPEREYYAPKAAATEVSEKAVGALRERFAKLALRV
jgi:hypothetical protein